MVLQLHSRAITSASALDATGGFIEDVLLADRLSPRKRRASCLRDRAGIAAPEERIPARADAAAWAWEGSSCRSFFRGRILRQWYLMDVLTDSACTITVTFDCSTVSIILNRTTVLNYEAGWAVVHGHSWEDSCVPKEPYFATAFVLGSSLDQVNLAPLVTEVRTGRAVSLS